MGGGSGKGGGGGTQIDPNAARDVYQRWYERGAQGWKYNPEGENLPPQYQQYAAEGYQTGLRDTQLQKQMSSMTSAFAMPELPTYEGPTYEEQLAMQQEQYGIQQRDELFASYLDAATAAADYVNAEIQDEMAQAKLTGVDYEITDEQRQQRINNYFASIWGEGQQAQLENLISEYGKPEGFTEWTVVRGDPSAYLTAGAEGKEKSVATSKPLKPLKPDTLLTEEDDTLGGTTTVLGV